MTSVKPINYKLEFEPIFQNFTFNGKESIQIKCSSPTNLIKINAAELKIKKCFVVYKKLLIKTKTKLDSKKEILEIKLEKKIIGNATLEIEFTGILNDRLLGFYRSKYKDKSGKTKYLATTQFEAADARRAFPCWDEPAIKATFDISIIAEKNFTAISNMPIIERKKIDKKYHYKFSKTPIMSTYLVYLGVGEFEFLTGKLNKILIRIVTTKGNKNKGKLSLEFTKKFLKKYEDYFGIKYPLPKLDLIAVPDFATGAMENWGAITFRETILLFDPKTSTSKTKQLIADVISHELAHQWFGNLVTMKWWDDLWLNESFATYMGTKIVSDFYPKWELWKQYLEQSMIPAMMIDGLKSSHPIHVKVQKPSEIREIFDVISYDKGGCVLRMLEHYVGTQNFQNGLRYFLKKYAYKNAEGKDLWDSLQKVSKKPVKSMMKGWINQTGYPLVEVITKNSTLELKQRRFLLSEGPKQKSGVWSIPLSVGDSDKSPPILMNKKSLKVSWKNKQTLPIINSRKRGFFRVKYSPHLLSLLKIPISKKKLNPIGRWSVQNDLFALCVSGYEKIRAYLDFSDAYNNEEDYLTSQNIANNFKFLYFLAFYENFANEIKEYALNYLRQLFDRLGWESKKNEKPSDIFLRNMVLLFLGRLNEQKILKEAQLRFQKHLSGKESIKPDLREVIFSLAAWNGNKSIFDTLIRLYRKSNSQEATIRVLNSLCNFKDPNLLLQTLQFSLTDEVRSQNIVTPILGVSANPYGRKIVWPWMKKNWKELSNKFGVGSPMSNRIMGTIALVADSSMEKEIRAFFKKNPLSGTERTLEQTLERIRMHTNFLQHLQREFQN